MNLLQQVQLAARAYLKLAYPSGVPAPVREKIQDFDHLATDEDLLGWSGFERKNNHYSLRLGNRGYPHMKMVFTLEAGQPVFYVDAHDSHFNVPPGVPGYEKLLHLRETNKKLKQSVEAAWAGEKLPIFGRQALECPQKNICTGMKVLAIDDETQILDMLGIIVSSMGATLMRAKGAPQARALIAEQGPPDLIFCDIMMPGESGYQFVEWLQRSEITTPVYFITGLTSEKSATDGVAEVLLKPFSAKSIMTIMKQYCQKKAQPRDHVTRRD